MKTALGEKRNGMTIMIERTLRLYNRLNLAPWRRVGTLHSVVAFGFNTAILAIMINLAAALF